MTSNNRDQRFGRVTIDDLGVSQRPFLFFFGRPFDVAWSEVTAWAETDQIIRDVRTGEERIDRHVLEFHRGGTLYYIIRPARDRWFRQIVDEVRSRLPDKETESFLCQLDTPVASRREERDR